MKQKKRIAVLAFLFLFMGIAFAQTSTIRGTVYSADDKAPIIGASVQVEGTGAAAVTNFDGQFTLNVAAGTNLIFSYIGMKTMMMPASDGMSIFLETDVEQLEGAVVTGYGTVKKSDYTGAASVLNTDKQRDLPVVSVTQMMEANMPGVSINSSIGSPGASTSISIRGIGSLSASNEPLYVLDGVPVNNGNVTSNDMNTGGLGLISTLNPADIENITILKDAATASLYGARGANGVVLITTRRARAEKTVYRFKASYGLSDLAMQFRPTMDGEERRELIIEGWRNAYLDRGQTVEMAQKMAEEQAEIYAPKPATGYSDWEDALFRTASQQNYDFSAMGGSQNTKFGGSLNYTKQENVAKNGDLERYSGRLNFRNTYKKFDLSMNAIFSLTKQKSLPGGSYYSNPMYALKTALHPSIPVYNEDGSYYTNIPQINNYNPLKENDVNIHTDRTARTFASLEAGYTFIEGLRLSTVFNVDYTENKGFRFFSPLSSDGAAGNGQGDINSSENMTYNSQTRLTYAKTFGGHSVDVLAGYEVKEWKAEYMAARAQNYATPKKDVLDNASSLMYIGHYKNSDALVSYVARANYDYLKRYYLSLSFRRDGSSRLHPSNRWDNFWAVSGSWRFSQEEFMKDVKWLNEGKLRMSYGVNGNIPNGLYSYYGLYSLGYSYNDQPGMVESSLANDTLSWERNYALNVGIDLRLFSRIGISFDWYNRNTKDLLLSKSVNPITGFGSITDNVGELHNQGVELELNATVIDRKDFYWISSFNLSHNENTVVKLADLPQYTSGIYIVKEGYSLNTIYRREYAGVDPQTGLPTYYSNVPDENGVPSREIVTNPNNAVNVPLKNIFPTVSGGFSNTFRYKFVDLNLNLSYSFGGYSYDNYMWALQDDGYSSIVPKSVELRRRWQNPGDVTDVPRYVSGQEFGGWWHSSRAVHSTDHIRLKSLILGVNMPSRVNKAVGLASSRIYVSGTNLLTWAAYDQYDPEIKGSVGCEIPPLKTLSFGVEIEF